MQCELMQISMSPFELDALEGSSFLFSCVFPSKLYAAPFAVVYEPATHRSAVWPARIDWLYPICFIAQNFIYWFVETPTDYSSRGIRIFAVTAFG